MAFVPDVTMINPEPATNLGIRQTCAFFGYSLKKLNDCCLQIGKCPLSELICRGCMRCPLPIATAFPRVGICRTHQVALPVFRQLSWNTGPTSGQTASGRPRSAARNLLPSLQLQP